MKIRLIGFLSASQIENAVALSGKIEPEKGTVFIQKGLSFTFTFKGDKAVGVTVRRAPNLKILGEEEEQEAKPEVKDKYVKETSHFEVGDRVKVKSKRDVDNADVLPYYTDEMDEECAGKTYTIARIEGERVALRGNKWHWIKDWLEPAQKDA